GDRSAEQSHFLEAIRVHFHEVLEDLFKNVLPLHLEARRRRLGSTMVWSRCDIWGDSYDFHTWKAAWDWAHRAKLTRGMALDVLRQWKTVRLARWCWQQPFWRRGKRFPPRLNSPFRIQTSPEITFGMPLLATVWLTLE